MAVEDAEDLARQVGRRIAELRRAKGLTQQGFGTKISASVQWISRVENGEQNLTLATMVKLARALGVRVAALFELPESNPEKTARGRPKKS